MTTPPRALILSNLAISVDGKIATRCRGHSPLGSAEDRRQMQRLRARCDAVVMGAGTLRAYRKFCGLGSASAPGQPANAVISSRLDGISPDWEFFRDPRLKRILFVSGEIPAARVRRFEGRAEIVTLRPFRRAPLGRQIVQALGARGYPSLLIEGGGELMWAFVSLDLIDEYHVTLTPRLVGGRDAPTLVEGPGFSPAEILNLRLASCRRAGDELYLVYKRRMGSRK